MTKWDKDYLELCKKILNEGVEVENRTGTNSIKIPSYHLHFDLGEEFPVLQSKQLYFRQAILEMLWIYQAQSNDVRWLQERNVHIWDEWEIDEEGIWRAKQLVDGKHVDIEKDFGKKSKPWDLKQVKKVAFKNGKLFAASNDGKKWFNKQNKPVEL